VSSQPVLAAPSTGALPWDQLLLHATAGGVTIDDEGSDGASGARQQEQVDTRAPIDAPFAAAARVEWDGWSQPPVSPGAVPHSPVSDEHVPWVSTTSDSGSECFGEQASPDPLMGGLCDDDGLANTDAEELLSAYIDSPGDDYTRPLDDQDGADKDDDGTVANRLAHSAWNASKSVVAMGVPMFVLGQAFQQHTRRKLHDLGSEGLWWLGDAFWWLVDGVDHSFFVVYSSPHFRECEYGLILVLMLATLIDWAIDITRFKAADRLVTLLIRQLAVRSIFFIRAVVAVNSRLGSWGCYIFPVVDTLGGAVCKSFASSVLAPGSTDASKPPIFGCMIMLAVTCDACASYDVIPGLTMGVRGLWGVLHRWRSKAAKAT
jgi:hypothetical protein